MVADHLSAFRLSQEMRGQKYLYASAFHYWNQIDYFRAKLPKQTLLIDLDCFLHPGDHLIPIAFEQLPDCADRVPIINSRTQPITVTFNTAELYQDICKSVAKTLLQQHFQLTEATAIGHLSQYLQRIRFFQRLELKPDQISLPLIVEILHQEQILHREIEVDLRQVQAILLEKLSPLMAALQGLASQYTVAIISQYSIFPEVRERLQSAGLAAFTPKLHCFDQIWQSRQISPFPLYGFYLDRLEFKVCLNGKEQWLEIASDCQHPISYEGERRNLRGRIPDTGRESFQIPKNLISVSLPIRVNGQDYCNQNNQPQVFQIEVVNQKLDEAIEITLAFCLQPDRPPELIVEDTAKRCQFAISLQPRKAIQRFGYLPPEKILSERQGKAESRIRNLASRSDLSEFYHNLSKIAELTAQITAQDNQGKPRQILTELKSCLKSVNDKLGDDQTGLLHHIDPTSKSVQLPECLKSDALRKMKTVAPAVLTCFSYHPTVQRIREEQKSSISRRRLPREAAMDLQDTIRCLLILIGKTYRFSPFLSVDCLWSNCEESISLSKALGIVNLYFHCLARTAITPELQSQYFKMFDKYYQDQTEYLWGYGRILMWYFDFRDSHSQSFKFDYREHFKKIAQYLKQQNTIQVKQNAFLALIYLLTFRRIDSDFCQPGSSERQIANELLVVLQHSSLVKLKQFDADKSLNAMFKELLEGNASEADVDNLIQGC